MKGSWWITANSFSKINDEEYKAELNRAKANIASAEAETRSTLVELERVKLLVDKNVVAKTELDLAEAKVEIARSKIKIGQAEATAAEIKLANTSIRSPFNGIMDLLPLKKGQPHWRRNIAHYYL